MSDKIFEVKKSSIPMEKINLKVPKTLTDEIDEIREGLKQTNPDLLFNVNSICIVALQKAVRQAKKKLSEMERPAEDFVVDEDSSVAENESVSPPTNQSIS